jgi:hypothetical protein
MKTSFLTAMAVLPTRSCAEVSAGQDIPVNLSLHHGDIADRNNKTDVKPMEDNNQSFVDPCPKTYRICKQWDKLSNEEQNAYLSALQQLKDHGGAELNAGIPNYDEIAYIHGVMSTSYDADKGDQDAIHGNDIFPTWHRWYLYQFETALRSLSGNCDLT